MKNEFDSVYSVNFELRAGKDITIPLSMGIKLHASFLNLVGQINPSISNRLHNEPGYRPYTVSPLLGGQILGEQMRIERGQKCQLRVTLLDGGALWYALQTFISESETIYMRIGDDDFQLMKLCINPRMGHMHLTGYTDWKTLANIPAQTFITIHFLTATAFSLGGHQFNIFPEPTYVWGSLLRSWNRYAPASYMVKREGFRALLLGNIRVSRCSVLTKTLYFPNYTQKGFVGSCSYSIKAPDDDAALLTTLAAFAYYAGVGYKTTMGMGQVRVAFDT